MSSSATEDFLRNTVTPIKNQGSELSSGPDTIEGRAQTEKIPRNRENDPTALDVIGELVNKLEEQKASVYMKGHISQEIINDTFLMDAKQKFPESTLRINCELHNSPATFYSNKEGKY